MERRRLRLLSLLLNRNRRNKGGGQSKKKLRRVRLQEPPRQKREHCKRNREVDQRDTLRSKEVVVVGFCRKETSIIVERGGRANVKGREKEATIVWVCFVIKKIDSVLSCRYN